MTEQAPKPDERSSDVAARSNSLPIGSIAVAVIVLVALAVGLFALVRLDSWGDSEGSPQRFKLDLAAQMEIPADLLVYSQSRQFEIKIADPVAIAVGATNAVYVAGSKGIEIIGPNGDSTIARLDVDPTCMTLASIDDDVRLYVGAGKQVLVLSGSGDVLQQWPALSAKTLITGIAATTDNVFVADAGQRIVVRYSVEGVILSEIGRPDPKRPMPGFVIPSPYFDVVTNVEEELVHIVNPGMRRIEAYNFEGELQSFWGEAGAALPNFFGCCNPAHLTRIADGRFVTSEKGIPRIKVYSEGGKLLSVVAGPKQLGVHASALGDARGNQKQRTFDVAVDGQENILVLDARENQVRVYERTDESEEVKS